MKKIIIISLVLHAILIWLLAPWMKTRMEFDMDREAERTEQVRKRELARQEHERLKREVRKLDEKTALKLKRDIEKKKKAELVRELDELRRIREEIMDRQQRELAKLQQRDLQDIIDTAQISFNQLAEDLKSHVETYTDRAMRRSICVGAAQNGHDWGAIGLIDHARIHFDVLQPPFDSRKPEHEFLFDGDLKDRISGKSGTMHLNARLVDSPESGGQAFQGDGHNARVEFWPFLLGERFTLMAKVKLQAKLEFPERHQLIFTNNHAGDWFHGFRVYVEPTAPDAVAGTVVFETSGAQKNQKTRALPDSLSFHQWHELVVTVDQTNKVARIYIDGRDVTAPDSQMATDFSSGGTTIDETDLAMASEIAEDIAREAPRPETAEAIKDQLAEFSEQLEKRMEETPDFHDVRSEISEAISSVKDIEKSLTELTAKTDLATMNDTSTSVADKVAPQATASDSTPAEMYQEAREIEKQISEAYADVDAAAKAASGNQAFSEARAETQAHSPPRPDLASELAAHEPAPTTVGDLDELRRNLDHATSEVGDMNSRARGLLGTTDNRSLTQTRDFAGSKFASAAARMSAARSQHAYGAVVDLTGGGGSDGDSQGMRGDFSGEGASMAAPDTPPNILSLDQGAIMAKALPGRRFTEESLRSGWLYLDTWYVIGPWDNKSNVNFDVKHPPEQEVNFDAEYHDGKFADQTGHPDRLLRWKFYQSDSVRCQPPKVYGAATYYAYTEVWFEQERDMLIAVASDDAASVWLNDKIIWQDRGQSAWQLGEGYRRVHFRKGYNKMLVRIENGPIHCIWSVLLCPPEVMK